MQTKVTTYEKQLLPTDAERWLLEWRFDRQRAIRPYHVQFLTNLMRQGRFRSHTTIEVAMLQGKPLLIEGYHTLSAVVQAQMPLQCLIIERDVETLEDVAHLYSTFNRDLMRTSTDIMQAYGFFDKYDFTKDAVTALIAAMKLLLSGFVWLTPGGSINRVYLKDQEILYNGMCQWLPEAVQFFEDIAGCPNELRKAVLRAGVVAVALVTLRYKPGGAQDFWSMVAHDSASTDHPAKALTHFLIGTPVKMAKGGIRYARTVAQCWNAFMRERTLKEVRIPATDTPIRLEGTPHDGVSVWRYLSEDWHVLHDPVIFDEPFFHRFLQESAA